MFVRLPNVPNVAHNLPLGSRLIHSRNIGSLGGWTLGSTNVEGGLHSPFLVKPNLTRSPKNHQLLCTFSQEPILVQRHYISLWTKMPEISHPSSGIPVQGPAFQFVHNTLGVHRDPKGGESDGHTQGFKKPPVPRRLVGESQVPPGLSPTYTGSSK